MRCRRTLLVRCAVADDGLAGNDRRGIRILRRLDCRGDGVGIVPVDPLGMPAVGVEPPHDVSRFRQRQRAVDRNVVVVEQDDQAVELEVAGKGRGFVADAFHQVAVARQHVGVMVDQVVAEAGVEMALGERHADGRRQALAQRSGGRLDPGRVFVLRMARRLRADLTEIPDLVDRHGLVAEQMQQGVEEHRAVARRQHEPVAIWPIGRLGVELEKLREKHGCDIGGAHRHAGMAGLGRLYGVHSERADGIGHRAMIDLCGLFCHEIPMGHHGRGALALKARIERSISDGTAPVSRPGSAGLAKRADQYHLAGSSQSKRCLNAHFGRKPGNPTPCGTLGHCLCEDTWK